MGEAEVLLFQEGGLVVQDTLKYCGALWLLVTLRIECLVHQLSGSCRARHFRNPCHRASVSERSPLITRSLLTEILKTTCPASDTILNALRELGSLYQGTIANPGVPVHWGYLKPVCSCQTLCKLSLHPSCTCDFWS